MKNDKVSFDRLRKILLDLGFEQKFVLGRFWLFEHAPTDSLLPFRHYQPQDAVNWGDISMTRTLLDMRGLMEADDFEDLLHKTPV